MVLLRLLGSQKGYERSTWVVTVRLALQMLGVTTSSDGVKAGWTITKQRGGEGRIRLNSINQASPRDRADLSSLKMVLTIQFIQIRHRRCTAVVVTAIYIHSILLPNNGPPAVMSRLDMADSGQLDRQSRNARFKSCNDA